MSCFVYQVVTSEGYLYYKKDEAFCFVLKIAASRGLLFLFQPIDSYSIVRINTQKAQHFFSSYDTIWQHAPVILRLVNHKFRAKLNLMVNQYGATLYKQKLPKGYVVIDTNDEIKR